MSLRLLLALLALPSLAFSNEPLHLQAAQIKALGIELMSVGQEETARGTRLPARVMVPNSQLRVVAAPLPGMLAQLNAAPGQTVRRGQVLARLHSPQALELQRDALQAGSQSGLLKQNLQRDEQLFAEGLIPEARLQASRAAAAQANTLSEERRQGLNLAGLPGGQLGGTLDLVSPIDGIVLAQEAALGQRLEAAAPVFRIGRLKPLWLEIQAPLSLAAGLREGTPVRLADSEVQARIIGIGRSVDPTSQGVLLRAVVDQGAETLTPGQVLEVDIAPRRGQLPATAVIRVEGKTWVFVQTTEGPEAVRFEARPVRLVAQGGNSVQLDGLRDGEKVVVKGVSGLKALWTGVGR